MSFFHILAATDFEESGDSAVRRAGALAQQLGAKLSVVHVTEPLFYGEAPRQFRYPVTTRAEEIEELFARIRGELHERFAAAAGGQEVSFIARSGRPRDEILALAESIHPDLIVMGTHARRGVARAVLGSVAEQIVRHAPTSVLVVRTTV